MPHGLLFPSEQVVNGLIAKCLGGQLKANVHRVRGNKVHVFILMASVMGHEEDKLHSNDGGINDEATVTMGENVEMCCTTYQGTEKDGNLALCRVCQCAESDRRGDAALDFLNITPPSEEVVKINEDEQLTDKVSQEGVQNDVADTKSWGRRSGFMEFVSPEGEVFICRTDIEAGSCHHQDTLINLGCSCKSDLAVAHYACALKWFINHGSTICEICGSVAKNVRTADFRKVMVSLKDYEALRERTVTGELTSTHVQTDSGVDPDAVAAIRRQRLSEISLWFNPHNNSAAVSVSVSQGVVDQSSNIPVEVPVPTENPTTKWAVESTGILVATGLLTVTLAWLIAPRVGKRTARSGLHILLGGICALTVVIFLRFIVLSRIKYGPARYWAILFVFWFLVFGIWASRTHSAHST